MEMVYYRASSLFPRESSVPLYDATVFQKENGLDLPDNFPQNALGLQPACGQGCLTLENCSHKSSTALSSQAGRSEEGGE
jgi:hypothetical protein